MTQSINILALITARGGSKRLPGKNIKSLLDKPLIAWTAEAALKSQFIKRVAISTDDFESADIVRKLGVEVPFMRPAALAHDETPHMAVLEHAMTWFKENEGEFPEYLLLLQPTSPLRTSEDIDAAVEIAMQKKADAVISVCAIQKNPTIQWILSEEGRLLEVGDSSKASLKKQLPSQLFAPNGAIYLIRGSVLADRKTLFPENMFPYVMPEERSLDVDTAWDFQMAELILKDQYATGRKR